MNQIHPHALWLGHAGDGRDVKQLFDKGIKVAVHLAAEELSPQLPRELIFLRFPLVDGDNANHLMLLALGSVTHLLKMRLPTLLYCGAGMSRSPAIAAGALAILSHEDPDKVLREIVGQHPADVSPVLWQAVRAHCLALGSLTAVK